VLWSKAVAGIEARELVCGEPLDRTVPVRRPIERRVVMNDGSAVA
jgi:hypothetical protein